jgi:hypothetical protein
MENLYYVYEHYTADTNEIFYVGYGKNKRPYDYIRRNKFWKNVYEKHGVVVKIIKENVALNEAVELECKLIGEYGRRDLGTGPLVNLTDGGDGLKNASLETKEKLRYIASNISEETREKMRLAAKNRPPMSEKTKELLREKFSGKNNPNYGKTFSEEHRQRLSESHKGMRLSEEAKKKVSKASKGRKMPEEAKRKISEALKGNKNGRGVVRKGLKHKKNR